MLRKTHSWYCYSKWFRKRAVVPRRMGGEGKEETFNCIFSNRDTLRRSSEIEEKWLPKYPPQALIFNLFHLNLRFPTFKLDIRLLSFIRWTNNFGEWVLCKGGGNKQGTSPAINSSRLLRKARRKQEMTVQWHKCLNRIKPGCSWNAERGFCVCGVATRTNQLLK